MVKIEHATELHDGLSEEARDLHASAIVIDAVAPHMDDESRWGAWVSGGATVVAPTAGVRQTSHEALRNVSRWSRLIREHAEILLRVSSTSDIHRAKKQKKLGVYLHFQDTTPLDADLDLVGAYFALGVRMMGLCYNFRNRVGDGSGESSDAGLSAFGRAVIAEMNAVGIVVDCSHTGDRTSLEAIETSAKPVVFSHSNPRAMVKNGRNIPDDLALAAAECGGVVGLGGVSFFVSAAPSASFEDWLDQLEYWLQLVGPDHVGLGLDFYRGASLTPADYVLALSEFRWNERDYQPTPHYHPVGLEDASKLPNITDGLLRRGYTDTDVRKVLGENWIRVFAANWGKA